VAVVALELGLPPREVWAMHPADLATVVDLLNERAEATKKASRRRR